MSSAFRAVMAATLLAAVGAMGGCASMPQEGGGWGRWEGPANAHTAASARAGRTAQLPDGRVVRISTTNAEECLAEAIHFEAGNQKVMADRQMVADVVKNRAAINYGRARGICQVVHQRGKHRRTGVITCQFSFTCEGPKPTVRAAVWQQAMELARQELARDGVSDPQLRKATHYHAKYVAPDWRHDPGMNRTATKGAHIVYSSEIEYNRWHKLALQGGGTPAPLVVVAVAKRVSSEVPLQPTVVAQVPNWTHAPTTTTGNAPAVRTPLPARVHAPTQVVTAPRPSVVTQMAYAAQTPQTFALRVGVAQVAFANGSGMLTAFHR